MADGAVGALEDRIKYLESLVYGPLGEANPAIKFVDQLSKINTEVNSLISGKEKISRVMKRLGELELYVDPSFGDKLVLSDYSKVDLILSEEERIKKQAGDIELIQNALEVFGSEHIKGAGSLSEKLQTLGQKQSLQKEEGIRVTEETKDTLKLYNSTVSLNHGSSLITFEKFFKK